MDKIATKEALSAVAQALSDRIAQRDYIRIPLESITSSITDAEKAEIRKAIENGTIWDVIFVSEAESTRVICVDPASHNIAVYSVEEGVVLEISYI